MYKEGSFSHSRLLRAAGRLGYELRPAEQKKQPFLAFVADTTTMYYRCCC